MAARKPKQEGPLAPYEGQQVIGAAIKLTGAATGLSEAMSIDPAHYAIGDKLYGVFELEVDSHTHKPVKDTNCLTLVYNLKASTATFVDGDLVADHLEKQRVRNQEAKGIHELPLGDGDDEPDPADPQQTDDDAWEGS